MVLNLDSNLPPVCLPCPDALLPHYIDNVRLIRL